MLQNLFFDVVDVEFRCCRYVMVGVVSRRRAPGAGCCTQHGAQHESLGYCVRRRREEGH
jgi:hypothetical protein